VQRRQANRQGPFRHIRKGLLPYEVSYRRCALRADSPVPIIEREAVPLSCAKSRRKGTPLCFRGEDEAIQPQREHVDVPLSSSISWKLELQLTILNDCLPSSATVLPGR